MPDRPKNLIAAAAALLLAGAICLGALLGDHRGSAALPAVDADQRRAFGVLRTEPSPPGPALAETMERVVESRPIELRPEAAQRVRTQIGIDAWVVPGDGVICVMGSRPLVAGCDTTRRTIKRGMSVVAIVPAAFDRSRKRYQLFGIAPDAVEQVAVTTEGGQRARVPVIENVYSYEAATMVRARLLR